MAGRHRKNRGFTRNDYRSAQDHDRSFDKCTQPPHTFEPISQDSTRRRPNVQAHSRNSGIHRPNDNSNPNLNTIFRNLKQQSSIVKRELEDLMSKIDEIQPDSAVMDWSGSAGTIVYIPVTCATDGSFQQPQMRSISNGNWPDSLVAFDPYAEPMRTRTSTSANYPVASGASAVSRGEVGRAGRDFEIMGQSRPIVSTAYDKGGRQVRIDASTCEGETERKQTFASLQQRRFDNVHHDHLSARTPLEMLLGEDILDMEGQRINQLRAAATSLPTPPPSPAQARRGSSLT